MRATVLCVAVLLTAPCTAFAQQYPFTTEVPPIALVPEDEWDALNRSVGHRLYLGRPVGLPCYNNYEGESRTPDAAACEVVEANKSNMTYLTTQMGGYAQGNWGICQRTNHGCPTSPVHPIDPSAPCQQGNVPRFYVDVRHVSDVTATLQFAAKHGVPIVVKNSGHDYKGRSAGPNSLALWMHNYVTNLTFADDFQPDGCSEGVGKAITFGSGTPFDTLYSFAHNHSVTVVGGSSRSVAPAGGWITGGGHSALSPVYGLGADNVQQIRVVLPNGTYVTANHCQNQEIFFALRGGGGGTFGVNMEMTYRAHDSTPIQFANVTFTSLNETMQRGFLSVLAKNANPWFESGTGGYAYPAGWTPERVYPVQLLNPKLSMEEFNASVADLVEFAEKLNTTVKFHTYPSFYELYTDVIQMSLILRGNYGAAMSSRLIPQDNLEGSVAQAATVDALMDGAASNETLHKSLMLLLVTPNRSIADSDSALTPAWRQATWHTLVTTSWDTSRSSPEQNREMFKEVTEAFAPLRALTPGGGAYLNEADTFEPDPIEAYWGAANYQRLVELKHELDEQGLMQVFGGIRSDAEAPQFRCYPETSPKDVVPSREL